jgi:hypothetical protein
VFHVSPGERMPNRCHPFGDRFVGCRAVAAMTRRQAGWWDVPFGGSDSPCPPDRPSRPDPCCTRFLESHSSCLERWRGDEPHGRTSASPSICVDGGVDGTSPDRRSLREGARPREEITGPIRQSGSATGGNTPGSLFKGRRRNRQSRTTVTVRGSYSEGQYNSARGRAGSDRRRKGVLRYATMPA